ncbi:MAG: hypothetical protein OEM21_02755 [Nitrosopumilus sp.]|nr:hypothetical protein [Nitrosopumilus sp.]
MKSFTLKKYSSLSQKEIFHISTDIKNFHKILPNYFKSLKIIEEKDTEKYVIEKLKFLHLPIKVKTKHVIIKPNIHEVYILNGPTKGTQFIETYLSTKNGSVVTIEVKLVFTGFMKIFWFLEDYVEKKMRKVMNEFISSAEKYYSISNFN